MIHQISLFFKFKVKERIVQLKFSEVNFFCISLKNLKIFNLVTKNFGYPFDVKQETYSANFTSH